LEQAEWDDQNELGLDFIFAQWLFIRGFSIINPFRATSISGNLYPHIVGDISNSIEIPVVPHKAVAEVSKIGNL
jgi:hypothetical protein